MNIDLDKASRALLSLKEQSGGAALEDLDGALEEFQRKLGVDLNPAEFRYVMQTLFNERVVTVDPKSELAQQPAVSVAKGFTIRAVV